jgi:predicted acyl esterase
MRIEWDVPVELEDGLVLRADVFLPETEDRYPVILSHGPYAKGLPFQDGYPVQWRLMTEAHPDVTAGSSNRYQSWEVVDPEKWVPHGYAIVRVDSRGAGRSSGFLDCWSPLEARDFYECIEWAAVQPWSNGRVGLDGISYYAINQWQVAWLQPPHLEAICAWEGAADHYRDITFHGGIPSRFVGTWYPAQVEKVQHGSGERGGRNPHTGELATGPEVLPEKELEANRVDLAAQALEHPLCDDFHRARSADWSKVSVPLLSAANWGGQGLHSRGNFEAFTQAASTQRWLECHGLEHWTHFYTDYGRDLQRLFFDHFLKGERNGWDDLPRVLLQVRRPGERFEQRYEHEWPLARTRWTRVYLDAADGTLRDRPEEAASVAYEAGGAGVTFWSPPADAETELTGPLSANLYISCSEEDADLFVVVRVFDPDDREVHFQGTLDPHTPIAQGWLRASHRKLDPDRSQEWRPFHSHDEVEPLVPNTVYELAVEIWPTSIVLPPKYRLALSVQGRDYDYGGEPIEMAWFTMCGSGPFTHDAIRSGTVTIHTGERYPSSLLLPVIP